MSEYAPTTGQVRDLWVDGLFEGIAGDEAIKDANWDPDRRAAQFDRWLAAHDAEVRAKALEVAYQVGLEDDEIESALMIGARFLAHGFSGNDIDQMIHEHYVGKMESEWEYGNEQLMHSHVAVLPASSEAVAKAQAWLYPVYRRRKAGPWVPVREDD